MSAVPTSGMGPQSQPSEEPTSRKQKKAAVRRMKSLVESALPLLQKAVTVASSAAGDAGVPGLSAGLSALGEILKQIETMKKTVKGVDALCKRVVELSKIITDFYSLPRTQPMPKEMKERLEGLSQRWERIAGQAKKIRSRNRIRRFFAADSDAERLGDLVEQINDSIQQDTIKALLNIEENARKTLAGVEKLLEELFMSTYAKGAQFDAAGFDGVRGACQEGTRVEMLEKVFKWVADACSQEGATPAHSVYWYNGLAGTGKTSIALSIAAWCREQGILGGSYFCSRFDTECSDPNSVFRTLSRQLCRHSPAFREKVIEILKQDSSIVHATAARQFEELILRPLQELDREHRPFRRCVVVIDALDECSDPDATSTILRIIAKYISDIAPFLVFIITSRPEERITHLFDGSRDEARTLKNATTRTLLHMVKLESVSDDIRRYLEKRLAEIRDLEYPTLDKAWLSSDDLAQLVRLSAGLFIWAATAVRFIKDPGVRDPKGQLQEILSVQSMLQRTSQTPGTILDPLYGQIADTAFSKISKKLSDRLQPILGTIVLAQEPLSVVTLGKLSENQTGDIRITLGGLHSVLHIPDTDDKLIRVIHPTFAEYLLQPPLSEPGLLITSAVPHRSPSSKLGSFSIDAAAQHARLFSRTLNIMGNLEPNIANLSTPSTFRREVAGLTSTLKERISGDTSYSCRHWSTHLEQCNDADQIRPALDSLNKFFHDRLLNWLEACSLLGALDGSIAALQVSRKACQRYGKPFALLAEFIFDCLRFTQTYYHCINGAPLQVYHSLLALAPIASLVKKQYVGEVSRSLLITRGAPPDWGLCVDTIIGHNRAPIFSVSFSGDGVYFATGGRDGHIRIWRTATRTSIKAILADDSGTYCQVAFSPSGAYVASAPDLRVWDVKSGDVVHTLEHEGVKYVAYSANGTRLASGSDEQIKIWDPMNATCVDIIASVRAGSFNGMSISSDGCLVGGKTAEGHAAIYNTSSNGTEALNQELSEGVFAFSLDGRYVAGHASQIVTIWKLKDKSLARTIDASSRVWGLTFSHDSAQIGCACKDRSVRIWTVASDDPPRVFAGHTDEVNALAWSPDDTQVISVGDDGTIRVWDLTRHHGDTTLAASPPSSFPPIPGAPCYAVLCTPKTTALLSLPAPIQPSTAASDAAEDAPIITLHADMADAWDAILQGGGASGEFAASRDWAFLTGRLHINISDNNFWPATSSRSLAAYIVPDYSGKVQVHNCFTGDHLPMTSSHGMMPLVMSFLPDNTYLAILRDGGALGIWDVTSQSDSPTKHFELELGSSPSAIAFSQDGSLLVAGTKDSHVHIYDATTGQSVKLLHGTRGKVTRITFSTDNRHVIAQAHPWLIIWDVATGDQILEFTFTHDHLPHSFDFAADGILISDGKGRTTKVTLWSPGDRTWPVYAVTEDGWLYAKSPGKVRRLCWLPPEWRAVFPLGGPRLCAPDAEQRRAVVFDVSRIPEYVETWGERSEARED